MKLAGQELRRLLGEMYRLLENSWFTVEEIEHAIVAFELCFNGAKATKERLTGVKVHLCVIAVSADNKEDTWYEEHGMRCRRCNELVTKIHLCFHAPIIGAARLAEQHKPKLMTRCGSWVTQLIGFFFDRDEKR